MRVELSSVRVVETWLKIKEVETGNKSNNTCNNQCKRSRWLKQTAAECWRSSPILDILLKKPKELANESNIGCEI